MKIYTYYEDINFKSQPELVSVWKESWERKGFEAIVLNESHARQHEYYKEFDIKINEVVELVTGNRLSKYGKSCYMRWLAYSTQPNEKFFVGDYDVINNNFEPFEPEDSLCFYDNFCPCFASGTPEQFYNLYRSFVDVSLSRVEQIKQAYEKANCRHYHDQDFLVCNCSTRFNPEAETLNKQYSLVFKPNKTVVKRPTENSVYENSVQLVHFSHFGVQSIFKSTFKDIDQKRIEGAKKLLNAINYNTNTI